MSALTAISLLPQDSQDLSTGNRSTNSSPYILGVLHESYTILTPELSDQICNSPYCQSYNSFNISLENLILDQLIILKLIFFFIHFSCLVDIVLIL